MITERIAVTILYMLQLYFINIAFCKWMILLISFKKVYLQDVTLILFSRKIINCLISTGTVTDKSVVHKWRVLICAIDKETIVDKNYY